MPRTQEELHKIAEDLYRGEIFTSAHVRDPEMIQSVFMVLIFLEEKHIQELKEKDCQVCFEYMSKAGPTSINGMPNFFSCQWLTRDEWTFVTHTHDQIKAAVEGVKGRKADDRKEPQESVPPGAPGVSQGPGLSPGGGHPR